MSDPGSPPVVLTWSEELGKRVRSGDWADQGTSTVQKIEEAAAAGRDELAAELVDSFMEEAKVCYRVYAVWWDGFREWLGQAGVAPDEIPGAEFDPEPAWAALGATAGTLANRLRIGLGTAGLEELREGWRALHDRWVDEIAGVLAFVAERFGEAALEDCYRHVLEPYIQERYMPYDLRERSWEDTLYRNLYSSFEAMRGHLCGPERRGDVELTESDDAWTLRFAPCGSGGRPEPAELGVTTERHDWAWNEAGVCHYCAHCCFALELLPAERWGHPVRIVDPPLRPQGAGAGEPTTCTWTIYKSLDAIPEEAYRRIGRTKPDQIR
jgi:hypothetical protein